MRTADTTFVGQLEDPLGSWVERAMNGVAEARQLAARCAGLLGDSLRDALGVATLLDLGLRRFEHLRTRLRGAEDHRTGAEDSRGDGAVQRIGVGRERHARGHVGRHHPVLGDRDQQQIEEEALVVARLAPREQQVEVIGEGQAAHQLATQIPTPDLDPVRIGLTDVGDRPSWLTDLHAAAWRASARR